MYCTMADAPSSSTPGAARTPSPVHVALSWSFTSTTILFGEGRRADLTRHAVFGASELSLGHGWSFRFGAGGILAGTIRPAGGEASFGPGVTAFVGVAKALVDERPEVPFVQVGATLSGSRVATRGPSPTEAPTFTAFDLRPSITVGKTLGIVVPYATARAFGGPIFYELAGSEVTGTDLYKYQLGGGLALALPSRVLDLFVEGIGLGERGVSAGVGSTF